MILGQIHPTPVSINEVFPEHMGSLVYVLALCLPLYYNGRVKQLQEMPPGPQCLERLLTPQKMFAIPAPVGSTLSTNTDTLVFLKMTQFCQIYVIREPSTPVRFPAQHQGSPTQQARTAWMPWQAGPNPREV